MARTWPAHPREVARIVARLYRNRHGVVRSVDGRSRGSTRYVLQCLRVSCRQVCHRRRLLCFCLFSHVLDWCRDVPCSAATSSRSLHDEETWRLQMKVDKHRAATSSEEAKHSLQMSSAESAPALAYSEKRYLKVAHMHTELTPAGAQEEDFLRRPAVRLFMPDALKSILVDDWEKVTKEQKLAPVPSPTPVTQFLNEYEASEMAHRRPNSAEADILEEVVAGVKEYFNKSLGRILLYRFERQQFYEMHKAVEAGHGEHAGKTLADLYGCEHLLRLFGELGSLRMYFRATMLMRCSLLA